MQFPTEQSEKPTTKEASPATTVLSAFLREQGLTTKDRNRVLQLIRAVSEKDSSTLEALHGEKGLPLFTNSQGLIYSLKLQAKIAKKQSNAKTREYGLREDRKRVLPSDELRNRLAGLGCKRCRELIGVFEFALPCSECGTFIPYH